VGSAKAGWKVIMRHSSGAERNQRPHGLIMACLTMLSVTSRTGKGVAGSRRVPLRSLALAEVAKYSKPKVETGNYRK